MTSVRSRKMFRVDKRIAITIHYLWLLKDMAYYCVLSIWCSEVAYYDVFLDPCISEIGRYRDASCC